MTIKIDGEAYINEKLKPILERLNKFEEFENGQDRLLNILMAQTDCHEVHIKKLYSQIEELLVKLNRFIDSYNILVKNQSDPLKNGIYNVLTQQEENYKLREKIATLVECLDKKQQEIDRLEMTLKHISLMDEPVQGCKL